MNPLDLEMLREILADKKLHIVMAEIQEVEVVTDRSSARVKAIIVPDETELVATLAWGMCSTGGGAFQLPVKGDWVLVGFVDVDEAFVLARLSSTSDLLPKQVALDDDTMLVARDGKKLHLSSDTKVFLGRGSYATPPAEPMVLGTVLTNALTDLYTAVDTILTKLILGDLLITTAPGAPTGPNPTRATELTTAKTTLATSKSVKIDTSGTNIKSQIAFTER